MIAVSILTTGCILAYTCLCQIVHGNAQPIWESKEAQMQSTTLAEIQLTRARAQLLAVAKTWADPEAVKHFQNRHAAALRHVHACRASNLYARAHERRIY